MLDKNFFTEQIKIFIDYLNRRYPGKDIKLTVIDRDMYYEKNKHLDAIKFAKIIKWLYETWNYGHFPLIADFVKARNVLFSGDLPEYKSETRIENVDAITKQKEWKRIIGANKILDYMENRCKQKGINWIQFIKDMLRKDMVYNKEDKKWVHTSKAVGNIFEPRKYYPPEYYK